MNNFAQIINFIMYVIDLIQGWFKGGNNADDNNDVVNPDEDVNEVV